MKKSTVFFILVIILSSFLRLYRLGENPPALYWDEASLGYNAFSILTAGVDEHGEQFPLARFIAFGDYKPPGYIYAVVPSLAVFGINEFAVRFPSAAAGIGMVIITYFLVKKLFANELLAVFACLILAISPWSLQLSRGAFEANLAAFFHLCAITSFIYAKKRKWLLLVSAILFILAFYTFNANRILTILFILLLGTIYWQFLFQSKKWVITSVVVGILLILPSVSFLQSRESRLRFDEVSIFTNLEVIKKSNERIERENNAWWAKLIHNRRIYYAREFISHYADNFKGEFLFISGDRNPRLSTQDVGELHFFEIPLIALGLFVLLKQHKRSVLLIASWILLAPIPSAVARETPHMLRIASILPTFQIISALGLVFIWNKVKMLPAINRSFVILLFIIILGANFYYYQHNYWVHYPRDWSGEWQYGYKQLVEKVAELENQYDRVVITQSLGRPYIYFLLYNQVSPLDYLDQRHADRDWFGFWNVYGFGKYDFTANSTLVGEKVLKVDTAPMTKILETIKNPKGEIVFYIGEP